MVIGEKMILYPKKEDASGVTTELSGKVAILIDDGFSVNAIAEIEHGERAILSIQVLKND